MPKQSSRGWPRRRDMGCVPRAGDCTVDDHRTGVFPVVEGKQALFDSCIALNLIANLLQDEAFSLWRDWASFYPPDSEERKLLDQIRKKRWLITVVHHDYKDTSALWKFLFSGSNPIA
jgi:hypothetical protein